MGCVLFCCIGVTLCGLKFVTMDEMELFSLEDEGNELFITQSK